MTKSSNLDVTVLSFCKRENRLCDREAERQDENRQNDNEVDQAEQQGRRLTTRLSESACWEVTSCIVIKKSWA